MNEMVIGILGVGGYLGKYAAKKLLNQGYRIIGAQRKKESLFCEYDNFNCEIIDVKKTEELIDFISKCDIVVNCVSPSHLYGKMIKDATYKQNKIYVDPSDMAFESDRTKVKGMCVGACGYIPGFSEYLAYVTAQKEFDTINRCIMYQGGFDGCSPGAFVDMILGAGNKNFHGDSYIFGTEIAPFSCDIRQNYLNPFSGKPVILKPIINNDNINLQQKIGAKEFYFFSAYDNIDTMKFFMRLLLDVSKYPKEVAAENIKRKLQERIKNNIQFGSQEVEAYLFFELEGTKNNETKICVGQVILKNVNKICGYFLAEVVDEIIKNPQKVIAGFNYGAEIISNEYMKKINREIGQDGYIEIKEIPYQERFQIEKLRRNIM